MHRRSFITTLTALIHGLVGTVVSVPVVRFLLAPLRRQTPQGDKGFIKVVRLADLLVGLPLRVSVQSDRWDAFVHHPPGPIGSVWLIRDGVAADAAAGDSENGDRVRCLQTICPHLGCGIDYAHSDVMFACPCHTSGFDLTGKALFGPSPRPMDELPCRVTDPDEHGDRWVEVSYRTFKTGTPDKEASA